MGYEGDGKIDLDSRPWPKFPRSRAIHEVVNQHLNVERDELEAEFLTPGTSQERKEGIIDEMKVIAALKMGIAANPGARGVTT